jgi:hypothetical protein
MGRKNCKKRLDNIPIGLLLLDNITLEVIASYNLDTTRLKSLIKENINVELQNPEGHYPILIEQIRKCYAVVVFTSSAGAPAVIEGKPLYVEHPTSYLNPMNAGHLSAIENPNLDLDRESVFMGIRLESHWTLQDIEQGLYFNNFLKKVKNV